MFTSALLAGLICNNKPQIKQLQLEVGSKQRTSGSHPEPAVQDGEHHAVQDEDPIQDVTDAHVWDGLYEHKTQVSPRTTGAQSYSGFTESSPAQGRLRVRAAAVSSARTILPSALLKRWRICRRSLTTSL